MLPTPAEGCRSQVSGFLILALLFLRSFLSFFLCFPKSKSTGLRKDRRPPGSSIQNSKFKTQIACPLLRYHVHFCNPPFVHFIHRGQSFELDITRFDWRKPDRLLYGIVLNIGKFTP